MEYSKEVLSYLIKKVSLLDEVIDSNENTSGIKGFFISNGEFCTLIELKFKYTPDPRRFNWNIYIKELAKRNEIVIAKNRQEGKKYFLMRPNAFECFLSKYPLGVKI